MSRITYCALLATCVPAAAIANSQGSGPEVTNPSGVTAPWSSLWWADYDADGDMDAVVLHPTLELRLLHNDGDGGFEDRTTDAGLSGLRGARQASWQDIDGDGALDLFLAVPDAESLLLRNTGAGTFESIGGASSLALQEGVFFAQWLDHDSDSHPDLFLATAERDVLYRNLGNGRFEEARLDLEARGVTASPLGIPTPGGGTHSGTLAVVCTSRVADQANPGSCINASSIPTLGMLYPISNEWFVDGASGYVGVGCVDPAYEMDVDGTIRTRSGGVRFPDGSLQTTATLQGPQGPVSPISQKLSFLLP